MRRRVVIVDGFGAASHRWSEALGAIASREPELVASVDDARAQDLSAGDVLVVDLPSLAAAELAAMRERIADTPAVRLLAADHDELAAVLQARADEPFRAIVPRGGRGESVREVAMELLRDAPAIPSCEEDDDWASIHELLRWTVSAAVRVPRVVIRSYRPRDGCLEVQLVFPTSRELDAFRCELPRRWGWPARIGPEKPKGDEHRSLERFGRVERDQEIYVRPVRGSSDAVYLALLPWSGDERITLAIGVWLDDERRSGDPRAAILSELHAQAVTEVPQLTIPSRAETSEGVHHLVDYDWVISPSYAGPERRREDTSVLNAYMFVGRRETLAKTVTDKAGGFVDAVPRWIAVYFVAYVALALVDAILTWGFVGKGAITELNPLLAPLVGGHSWTFFAVKNACALAAFAIIVRFHLFRRARLVLRLSVGAYALLDAYWAVLLLGTLP